MTTYGVPNAPLAHIAGEGQPRACGVYCRLNTQIAIYLRKMQTMDLGIGQDCLDTAGEATRSQRREAVLPAIE